MTRFYMICTTARSGSNLLCDYLSREGNFGKPWELFNPSVISSGHAGSRFQFEGKLLLKDYIDWLIATYSTANGVFGVKVLYEDFIGLIQCTPFHDLFKNSVKILLSRHSVVDQAISYYFAQLTGQWLSSDVALTSPEELELSPDAVVKIMQKLLWQNGQWKVILDCFNQEALELATEDVIVDPRGSVIQIADALGVPHPKDLHTTLAAQSHPKKLDLARSVRQRLMETFLTGA